MPKNQGIHILCFLKKGVYHILRGAKKGAIRHAHPYYVKYGYRGSVEKKIDLYNIHVHNPEVCCFIVFPDLVRSV